MLYGILAIITGYLLGSFPSAYLMSRFRKGIDIRDVDNGNMGAGAVMRQIGKVEGGIVVAVDVGKGAAAVYLAYLFGAGELWAIFAGVAAILGHNFPLYVGFRGGQGAACTIGVFMALAPAATGIILLIIGMALLLTRSIFNSISIAAPFMPVLIWLFHGSTTVLIFSLVIVGGLLARNVPKFAHMAGGAFLRYRSRRAARPAAGPRSPAIAGMNSQIDE